MGIISKTVKTSWVKYVRNCLTTRRLQARPLIAHRSSLITLFLCASVFANAQVNGKAVVDSTRYILGDQSKLRLELSAERGTELPLVLSPGMLPDSSIEFLGESKWDTLQASGTILRLRKELAFAVWDTGMLRLPSIVVPFRNAGVTDTFRTRDIPIEVCMSSDTTFADIKPIIAEPVRLQDYLWYIVGVGLLVLVALLVLIFYRRKKTPPPPPVAAPPPLPHEVALQNLAILEAQQMWQNGNVKGYHSALTYIVREYLEGRYGITALEQTTDEILEQLRKRGGFDEGLSKQLAQTLQTADLVKFAKAQPTEEFHRQAMVTARQFVLATKPVEVPSTAAGTPQSPNNPIPQ